MLFCVFVAGAQDKDGKGVPYRYEVRLGWSGYPTADDNNFVGVNNHGFYSYSNPIRDLFSDYDGPTYMTGNIVGQLPSRYSCPVSPMGKASGPAGERENCQMAGKLRTRENQGSRSTSSKSSQENHSP